MVRTRKLFLPSLHYIFRTLVVAIFLIGMLPVPALAVDNGILAGQVTNNTSSPISGVTILVFAAGSPTPGWSANTSGTGNYSIVVPVGNNYMLSAMKADYVTTNITGRNVTVNATTTVNFILQGQPPPSDTTPPAAITNLTAINPGSNNVTLTWTAPGDDGATGTAAQYDIRYALSAITNNTTFNAAPQAIDIPFPHTASTAETFIVTGLSANTTYFFAIKTADEIPNWSGLSNSASANTTTGQPPPGQPSFNITHSSGKSSFMLGAGANITESFYISSINSFIGTITLSLQSPPEIQSNSILSPISVNLTASENRTIMLNLGASALTPSGTYQCSIGGQTPANGGQQRNYFFTVIVGVPGQPLLSASPAVVAAGSQTTFFASQFTPSANITLRWDSGPRAGQTLATGQVGGDGTWNTTVTISANMSGGNFAVKAISGDKNATCPLTITVAGAGPDFLMSTSPQFISIVPGGSGNITIYVTSVNDFNAAVALSPGTAPGVTCTLSTGNVTPSATQAASATLTITVAAWASPNMYQINVGGACADPPLNKFTNISLDIQPPAQWGPGLSLSQSYASAGNTITVSGANYPSPCNGKIVTIIEATTNTTLQTNPATITVSNGSFTGTFTTPAGIPSGNYRIKAIVATTGDFAEREFQILGTGETFTLGVSPSSATVTTEQGSNSATVTVNLFSIGGNSPTVNLALEGAPPWLTYQFGSLSVNTPATGVNAVSVPAGGSSSRDLSLTASLTAPTGSYSITVKGWITGSPDKRIALQLSVQPPAGFGMAQFNLSPTFGGNGQLVNFSGSGFTGNVTPSQVTELKFGGLDILLGQNLPTITVPTSGDSAGRFSGTFHVPAVLSPGTYPVDIRVGTAPNDKFISKPFTITGGTDSFVLQASPSFLWVEQGGHITTMIQVQSTGSASATVMLSLEGYPSNDIVANLSSSNVTAPPGGTGSTDLTLTTQTWLPAGHYTITVKGQLYGGAEVHRIPLEMDVAPPAGSGMASIYLSPTSGSPGTWITISGSGFPVSSNVLHLYLGSPSPENDWVSRLPAIVTNSSGALSAVMQISANLTPGMYPIEVVVGSPPAERRASAQFNLVSSQASFTISLSPMMIQAAPGTPVSTSVNVQAFGASSTNITLRVEGPLTIEWRFDGGSWNYSANVSPPIGGSLVSSLEVRPKASTPMGHYSLAVKASAGAQTEMRNLEMDIGASAGYNMPIFSLNPNTGMAGTNIAFSGTNFPPSTAISGMTFGSANITLGQVITTSAQGSFSGAFVVPATMGGQPIAPGTYPIRVFWGQGQAETQFNVYGSDDTFVITLSPNFLQGGPGTESRTSGLLKALGGAAPAVKMAVRGLPPGVDTNWNGVVQQVYNLSAPPGGQNNFELGLVLPGMIPMGQYPAVLEGWVDTNSNNAWDNGEKIVRVNLQLSVMPPQGYGMGMLSLSPTFGQVGDTVTLSGSGFGANATVASLTFAGTNVLTANITTSSDGSFSGVFTVPSTAFGGAATGPGRYPVEVVVGTPPNDRKAGFDFQVVSSNQKFSLEVSPGWLARPAGDTGSVNIAVRSLVTTPPSPTIVLWVQGLPMGVTPSFTTANVTPPFGGMEGRELRLTISSGTPMGNYPISVRAYDAANPTEEIGMEFTLEVTPSAGFMDMGMAMVTLSPNFGSAGDEVTVSGYGFPKNQNLTHIHFGSPNNYVNVTPMSVNTTTDATGAFSAVIRVPDSFSSGPYPVEVKVQDTIRALPFNIMGVNDTFSLKVSPSWLEPIPAGDANGRQISISVTALLGKTPTVNLSTEGLFAAYGTVTQTWSPDTHSVNVTSAGGAATATLTLIPSANLPPGPYPFNIVAVDGSSNRRDYHMEFQVGPAAGFTAMTQQGVYFPDIFLSPRSGPAGTQISYTGTNLPAGANVTSITFAGRTVLLPAGGITADSNGGFSGTLVVEESWNLPPGGMYFVNFRLEKETWRQDIGKDFNLVRSNAAFTLEANPNWLPPIAQGGTGQTVITVKAMGYNSANLTLAVMETFGGMGMPGGAVPHWNATTGPATDNVTVPGGGQTTKDFYLQGNNPGHYMITIIGWIDSNNNQIMEPNIPSEAESAFPVSLEFDVQPPQGFMNWDRDLMMERTGISNNEKYLLYFPEIVVNPGMGQADTKVNISATDFPAGANVTHLRFASVELPVPATAADGNGSFNLVFSVPRTIWDSNIGSGWYDVEVEAQKTGEPPVSIRKPFQVTAGDVAFTIWAEPSFLPPIATSGNASTLIRVKSTSSAANITLSVDRIPPGVTTSFSSSSVSVTAGGAGSATLTLTPTTIPPGHYGAEIKGTTGSATFFTHIEFDIQPPTGFMNWDREAVMGRMDISPDDKYLLYFPEIVLNPNMGQAGNKVSITATDFPTGANVTYLRFAGMQLPVPPNTAADNITGAFTLILNVPRTIWGGNIGPGWYDIEVEAQKPGEPPVSIRKPFQVTNSEVAFAMRADPNFLPPIPPAGSSTTIRIESLEAGANVTLSMDKIPAGITPVFAPTWVDVPPGGSGTTTLTLTPANIPPGHYSAEIKGMATISGSLKTVYAHIEFDVQPSTMFKDTTWMQAQGVWFPEITLNPGAGPVKTKVTISATDFPAGANVTHLRFAGRELPVPANTVADSNGNANLVFNVPGDFGVGQYMVEVEAQKPDLSQVFIAKPFFVQDADVTFKLNVTPSFMPGVTQGSSGNTTVSIESTGRAVTVQLYVDGMPPGVTSTFDNITLTVDPGSLGSTRLTITTRASTPPGQYPLTIRGVSGNETRIMPFGFGVMPPTSFQMPKFTLNPDYAPAGYTDKQYKITFAGTGFPVNQSVSSLKFGTQTVAIPANLVTDAYGNFNGVFQMPTGLDSGTYDVRVAVADGSGGYVYDSRPFSIRGADAKFILQLSPPYLPPVVQGGNVTITVNTRSVGTTSANITLYVDGLAPGITTAFSPSNNVTVSPGSSGSAAITFNVSESTPPGPYPVSIRGITGNEAAVVPLGFGVMPNIGGGEGHGTITINPPRARPGEHIGISGAGFTSGNTITLTAAPPGASANTIIDITPTGGTIRVQSDGIWAGTWATEITVPPVPPGTYVIKASDGVMAAKNTFSIVPAENADFFLNLSPQFLKVTQGYTGNTTLTLSSQNGYKAAVRFSVGHLPPGVTATFQDTLGNTIGRFTGMPGGTREIIAPTPLTPIPGEALTVTVLIVTDTATPIGPYDIALEARTTTIARSVPLGLMVVSTGANMIISPSSGPSDTDIRLSGSGYTAGETVRITFASNNIITVPADIIVAPDGTFTAIITAPVMSAGIYPVKATGGNSGISLDRPFSLKPSTVSFVLYTSPMKVDVPRGGSGNVTAKIEPLGSFQSAVTLSITGLSNASISGASASISPSATITPSVGTPTTATITLNVPAGATEGKYTLIVTGTSGAITNTQTITLNVVPLITTPDFAISLAPNTVTVGPSSSVNTTVTVTAINGYAGTVGLAVTMSSVNATWPAAISYTTANITPSANTGMGKQEVTFTTSANATPGTWTFRVTGTSGNLMHSTDVMVISMPSGTTVTSFASPRLDPTTVTPSTPLNMTPPWGDRITIQGIINGGSEASIITPSSVNVTPARLAALPSGATDILGRVTNVESSSPVDGVQWDIGFPYDPDQVAAAGLLEENLKVAYLDPFSGNWTEVTTRVDTTNKIAHATPTHFSSWTLIASPTPPVSQTVTQYSVGGGGGGAPSGVTSLAGYITTDGRFIAAATAQSVDSKVEISIPKDTIGLNSNRQPLYSISIREQAVPADPPADTRIIGLVYDIGPSGATFQPPVNLKFTYSESLLPAGVSEDNLVIATWQDETWVELEGGTIDAVNNSITVPVSHFTIFTVMAHTAAAKFEVSSLNLSPAVSNPAESITVKTTVSNTGDLTGSYDVVLKVNGNVTSTEKLNLAGHTSKEVSFTLKLDKAGTYTIDINGTAATLTIREAPAETTETPTPTPAPTATLTKPAETRPPETAPAPTEKPTATATMTPAAPGTPSVPVVGEPPKGMGSWLIFLIVAAAGVIIIGLVYLRTRARN